MTKTRSTPPAIRLETIDDTHHLIFNGPILITTVLQELARSLRRLAAESEPRPVVLRSNHPTVFLAGADLREIAALDPETCIAYAEHGRSVVALIENHPAPIVAAVAGSCSGGAFDLVMACDSVVASPQASFDHPGVRRGLVTGWSGSVSVPSITGASTSRAVFIEGRRIDSECAMSLGLVSRIASDPAADATKIALSLAGFILPGRACGGFCGEADSLTDSAPPWYINYENVATCLFRYRLKISQIHGSAVTLGDDHRQRREP